MRTDNCCVSLPGPSKQPRPAQVVNVPDPHEVVETDVPSTQLVQEKLRSTMASNPFASPCFTRERLAKRQLPRSCLCAHKAV
mmetsp:Transcript_114075/g.170613  ORF Transcript_114075/g.170613 Transcript_114075/m.170613 type:complete len:82 (-) Transcript_114075:389-634(-)